MPEWISFVEDAALKSSALLMAAWIAAKLLRKRSAAVRHMVWTAAAAAVLALPFLSIGLPSLAVPGIGRLEAFAPAITFHGDATAGSGPEARTWASAAVRSSHAAAAPWHIDWTMLVVPIWAAGTALGLCQMLIAGAILSRRRRSAPRHAAAAECLPLARAAGIESAVQILEGPADSMPMACGWLWPAIFLPASAMEWTQERRRLVVLHELAHVRRGDIVTHLLARTALSLYWWSPLAWVAWREFLKERERAADDFVLLSGARAADYAAHLLEVARSMQPARSLASAAVAMARRSQLEGRLLAILDSRRQRKSVARIAVLTAAVGAVVLVAPFAAMRAQDQSSPKVKFRSIAGSSLAALSAQETSTAALPADIDATIRAALAQKNHEILEQAAATDERRRQFDAAQKLLEAALTIREQTSGSNSVEYAMGLAQLGDLALKRRHESEAIALYTRAVSTIGDRPAAAQPLTALGIVLYTHGKYDEAQQEFRKAQVADPAHAVVPLIWMALTEAQREGHTAEAESYFRQAIAAATLNSAEAAMADDFYGRFLEQQGRTAEAESIKQQAAIARSAAKEQAVKSGAISRRDAGSLYRVGGGVSAPTLLYKLEPSYTEAARAARYQGMVLLAVEVGTDGLAHNVQVLQGLGLGLDEEAVAAVSQWKFKPGAKGGVPVPVAAQIEVNFKLL